MRPEERTKVLNDEIVPKIIKYYSPKKVILFGSSARGDIGLRSDFDLVVVAESNKNFIERLRESAISVPYKNVDIMIYTPEEFEIMIRVENQFISTIIREGKVIYESKE